MPATVRIQQGRAEQHATVEDQVGSGFLVSTPDDHYMDPRPLYRREDPVRVNRQGRTSDPEDRCRGPETRV